jgi:hypothetical protein
LGTDVLVIGKNDDVRMTKRFVEKIWGHNIVKFVGWLGLLDVSVGFWVFGVLGMREKRIASPFLLL